MIKDSHLGKDKSSQLWSQTLTTTKKSKKQRTENIKTTGENAKEKTHFDKQSEEVWYGCTKKMKRHDKRLTFSSKRLKVHNFDKKKNPNNKWCWPFQNSKNRAKWKIPKRRYLLWSGSICTSGCNRIIEPKWNERGPNVRDRGHTNQSKWKREKWKKERNERSNKKRETWWRI